MRECRCDRLRDLLPRLGRVVAAAELGLPDLLDAFRAVMPARPVSRAGTLVIGPMAFLAQGDKTRPRVQRVLLTVQPGDCRPVFRRAPAVLARIALGGPPRLANKVMVQRVLLGVRRHRAP